MVFRASASAGICPKNKRGTNLNRKGRKQFDIQTLTVDIYDVGVSVSNALKCHLYQFNSPGRNGKILLSINFSQHPMFKLGCKINIQCNVLEIRLRHTIIYFWK